MIVGKCRGQRQHRFPRPGLKGHYEHSYVGAVTKTGSSEKKTIGSWSISRALKTHLKLFSLKLQQNSIICNYSNINCKIKYF